MAILAQRDSGAKTMKQIISTLLTCSLTGKICQHEESVHKSSGLMHWFVTVRLHIHLFKVCEYQKAKTQYASTHSFGRRDWFIKVYRNEISSTDSMKKVLGKTNANKSAGQALLWLGSTQLFLTKFQRNILVYVWILPTHPVQNVCLMSFRRALTHRQGNFQIYVGNLNPWDTSCTEKLGKTKFFFPIKNVCLEVSLTASAKKWAIDVVGLKCGICCRLSKFRTIWCTRQQLAKYKDSVSYACIQNAHSHSHS